MQARACCLSLGEFICVPVLCQEGQGCPWCHPAPQVLTLFLPPLWQKIFLNHSYSNMSFDRLITTYHLITYIWHYSNIPKTWFKTIVKWELSQGEILFKSISLTQNILSIIIISSWWDKMN